LWARESFLLQLKEGTRIGTYGDTVLYLTLMPCYLCSGAIVQFGIKNVVIGESETFRVLKNPWSYMVLK